MLNRAGFRVYRMSSLQNRIFKPSSVNYPLNYTSQISDSNRY